MRARLFQTTSVRLAALGVGLASASAAVVFGVIYVGTLGALRATLDTDIDNEISEIMVAGVRTPPAVIAAGVRAAIAEPPTGTFYRLDDAAGRLVAGDIALAMPAPGWHDITVRDGVVSGSHIRALRIRVERVSGGGTLLVAADATMLDELDELIRRSFLIGFGITLAIGLAAGIGFGQRALARVAAVSAAGEEIMAGDFTRRIPLSGSGDEFDHLARGINAMLARIEQLMGNIRAVGDEIAHDLRSPLARLRESLELMISDPDPVRLPAALADAIAQVDAALALSAGILRLAQIESGARRSSFATLDLSRLLEDIAETYESVAEDTGATLVADIAPGLTLAGDAALLNQLFANLIENAIKHGGDGAAISLSARLVPGLIVVVVTDDGPGIAPGLRGEALRRFGRLDPSRAGDGHGLGLPLAAAIAALHDGTLTLGHARDDATRPGLAVTMTLPISDGTSPIGGALTR
jgi:signal transduction histidine kinase